VLVIPFRNLLVRSTKPVRVERFRVCECVDFVWSAQSKIVRRFRRDRVEHSSQDRVSVSPRSCVYFTRCSLKFGSDLKNLHQGGECRERTKTGDRVKKTLWQDFGRPSGRPTCTRLRSVDRSVDRYCTRKRNPAASVDRYFQ